ncbi:zinc finger BED domain-containing protein 4-like isoform X2 [Sceloporus undulatus]|uniref:zinc finger BED domain-containing protein 4-like isoform X2 n=1 Tax=Sceloporus undulatus TaxID=8520 RepID=UPI001C4C3D14|nr:zinc finger BED domain-containing protein 4-like isoform X2 [Sceloporus undulatus]
MLEKYENAASLVYPLPPSVPCSPTRKKSPAMAYAGTHSLTSVYLSAESIRPNPSVCRKPFSNRSAVSAKPDASKETGAAASLSSAAKARKKRKAQSEGLPDCKLQYNAEEAAWQFGPVSESGWCSNGYNANFPESSVAVLECRNLLQLESQGKIYNGGIPFSDQDSRYAIQNKTGAVPFDSHAHFRRQDQEQDHILVDHDTSPIVPTTKVSNIPPKIIGNCPEEPADEWRLSGVMHPASMPSHPFMELMPAPLAGQEPTEGHSKSTATGRRHSFVWDHFDRIADNPHVTICRYCHAQVKVGKPGGCKRLGTSSMIRHLEHRHPVLYNAQRKMGPERPPVTSPLLGSLQSTFSYCGMGGQVPTATEPRPTNLAVEKQLPIGESLMIAPGLSPNSSTALRCTQALAKYIAISMVPFSIVEDEAFLEFVRKLCPRWEVPGRQYLIQTAFPALETDIRTEIRKDFTCAVAGVVHFTSHCWTSSQSKSYLCVTAHCVARRKRTLVRRAATLMLTHFSETHSATNIDNKLQAVVQEWLAPQKLELGCLVTYSGSSFLRYAHQRSVSHIPCMAHCISFLVRNALKDDANAGLKKVVDLARRICHHFKTSRAASEAIHRLQVKHGLSEHRFMFDAPRKWNNTLYMLQRLVEQKRVVMEYLLDHTALNLYVNPEQWDVMQGLVDILVIFDETTAVLSAEDATIGQVLPSVAIMEHSLEEFLDRAQSQRTHSDSPAIVFAQNLLQALRSSRHISGIKKDKKFYAASILELLYRDSTIAKLRPGALSSSTDIQLKDVEDYILQCGLQFYRKLNRSQETSHASIDTDKRSMDPVLSQQQQIAEVARPTISPSSGNSVLRQPNYMRIMFSQGLVPNQTARYLQGTSDSEANCPVHLELEAYLQEMLPKHYMNPDTKSLSYWEQKLNIWPSLARTAIWLLSCPPTSVPSERVFSTTENIVTKLRTRLTPENVCRMAFIQANRSWIPSTNLSPPPEMDTAEDRSKSLGDEEEEDTEVEFALVDTECE